MVNDTARKPIEGFEGRPQPKYDTHNPPEKVKKWIKRLKKCLKAKPKGLWFFSNGELNIMVVDENGELVYGRYGEVDQEYIVDSISSSLFEGGDF